MTRAPSIPILLTSLSMLFDRVAFYGMRVLLFQFMMEHLMMEESRSIEVYSIFTMAVSLIPLLLGPIIDFGLGPRRGAFLGGILSAFGALLFILEIEPAVYVGLGLIAAGTSFSRLGNFTILARSFATRDNTRDIGFGVMYIAINIGALIATTSLVWISGNYGYSWSFLVCAISAIIGSGVIAGAWNLLTMEVSGEGRAVLELGDDQSIIDDIKTVELDDSIPQNEKKYAPISFLFIGILAVIFWSIMELAGSEIHFFMSDFSLEEQRQNIMLNPLLLLIVLPIFLVLLRQVNRRKMQLHYMWLMAISAMFCLVGVVLVLENQGSLTLTLVIVHNVLITFSEIVYPAIASSHITRLAPRGFTATSVACYLAVFALANSLSGYLMGAGLAVHRGVLAILFVLLAGAVIFKLTALRKKSF